MGELSREESIRYFGHLKEYCEMFLKSLVAVPEYIDGYSVYIDDQEKGLYWKMTVEYGRRNMQMHIE